MFLSNDQITQIKTYFSDKPLRSLYLFGSYADGTANDKSDIDLVFSMKEGTRISYFGLAQYLVDLEKMLKKKVDLVESECMYPRVKENFDKQKKMIF